MRARHTIRLVLALAILTCSATAEDFPYAKGTFDVNGKIKQWTLDDARMHRDGAIGNLAGKQSVMEKDNAANPDLLAYKSDKVEDKTFETELDLTNVQGFVQFAIQVDDQASLTVEETNTSNKPSDYTPIKETYNINGTALWNKDRSYKEFSTPIFGGHTYKIKLNYRNTANLTKQYNGAIDYDGVNIFLILLPVDFEVVHNEKERDNNDKETTTIVNPGKDALLRDEIADLRIKVPNIFNTDWDLKLDLEPANMKTAALGARGSVQMYDFGKVDSGKVTPLTVSGNGTTKTGPYDIKILKSKDGKETFMIVVNNEGKFKLRLKSADNKIDFTSQDFTVLKRIRKYATLENSNQHESNSFDKSFENSANWWTDWEIGDTSGNYTFKDATQRYTPELLKAIAWKECDLYPANAAAHGTNQFDIMQVNAGNRPGSADMSGSSALADWNERAPTKEVEVWIDGSYQKKPLFLFWSERRDVPANDYSVCKMQYSASGLKPIGSYRESIKWSLRKLLYKQYNLGSSDFAVTYRVKGAGETLFAVKKPDLRALDETVRRYGDITPQYSIHVFLMRDEGIATRGSGIEYRWPRLTNNKARH